jgi:hypothetical protein
MEHRYTQRKPIALDVVVSCARIGLVRGRTVNIGCGGMYVATDAVVMPLNAAVSVAFAPSAGARVACFQVPAMVVHQGPEGFGLMFDELDPACRRALRALLAAAPAGWEAAAVPGRAVNA